MKKVLAVHLLKTFFLPIGVYQITLPSGQKEVRCNMDVDGGGWLVFLHRFDGSVDFYERYWNDYKNGFGSASSEMWLGNEHLHYLTTWKKHEIYNHAGRFPPNQNDVRFSKYDNFKVESESNKYQLKVGNLADGIHSLEKNIDRYFSTKERDNDNCMNNGNACVCIWDSNMRGGFWYDRCGAFYPTGTYVHQEEVSTSRKGIFWSNPWLDQEKSLKWVEMMIRRVEA